MCMVENKWGGLDAACSTPPKEGMEIWTNTERLRKYRKMILELLLADHCRDCTTCHNNGKCKLQDLAMRFNIEGVRFPNGAAEPRRDDSSLCISRDHNKCILCGDCVRMCNEIQGVGAIDFARRGSKMTISTVFDIPIAESNCVGCGQCAAVCPTGAIVVKNDTAKVWKALDDKKARVLRPDSARRARRDRRRVRHRRRRERYGPHSRGAAPHGLQRGLRHIDGSRPHGARRVCRVPRKAKRTAGRTRCRSSHHAAPRG